MRFAILPSIACLIAIAVAQTSSTANPPTVQSDFSVTAGKPSTFTWKPTTNGPVTLTLRSGAASDLNKGTVIASGIQNSGSYTFTLPADTTRNSDYTIEISADGDPSAVNYSAPFVVESSNTVESMTPSASASATSSMTMASASSSASSVSSAASSSMAATSSMASSMTSAMSASSTASAKSATMSKSTMPGASSSTSSKSAASTGASSTKSAAMSSATSSGAGSSGTQAAAAAPSLGAGMNNVWNVQSGLLAVLVGAVAVY